MDIESFRQVVDLWPSPEILASELGATAFAVRKWKQRDSIPSDWWLGVIEASKKLTLESPITVEFLAELASNGVAASPEAAA